jgi:hypothetical protein
MTHLHRPLLLAAGLCLNLGCNPSDGGAPAQDPPDPPDPPVDSAVPATPDAAPPEFGRYRLVEIAASWFCAEPTPCAPGWQADDGRPIQEHPAACVDAHAWDPAAFAEDSGRLVCLLDYLRTVDGAERRGVIAVLDVHSRTWSAPPDGRDDFVRAGLIEAGAPRSKAGSLRFARDLDAGTEPSDQAALFTRSPTGPLLRRGPDGLWTVDAAFLAAAASIERYRTAESEVVDLNRDGRPDVLQMACVPDGVCLPVVFYRTGPTTWQASQNFSRIPNASSDAYAWQVIPEPDGRITLAAAGADERLGGAVPPSGLFIEDAQPGPDGLPAWTEIVGTSALAGQGMGTLLYDLRGAEAANSTPDPDGQPELLVSTTVQCPEVLQRLSGGIWFSLTAQVATWVDQPGRYAPGCWVDPTPATEELAWGMAFAAPDLLLVAQGDDGRVLNGLCPAAPHCPIGGEPMIAYKPHAGRLWAWPLDRLRVETPDGLDVSLGNRRTLAVHRIGEVDVVVTGGVYEGLPQVFIVEAQE